ncbi:MAG TPA: hypothetical protein VJY35_05605 [Candidatus Eisenbacteria bacterium]|nr:hypothetical protein [Candidatus Eisenbacteria bacterium]
MKKLLFLAVIVAVGWYGWKHLPSLIEKRPSHEAVVQNGSGGTLTRIRLTVDGQTFVKEELPDGASAIFPFRVAKDASFELTWQWKDRVGENSWTGGMVPKGPMVQRHVMIIDSDAGVIYQTANK